MITVNLVLELEMVTVIVDVLSDADAVVVVVIVTNKLKFALWCCAKLNCQVHQCLT